MLNKYKKHFAEILSKCIPEIPLDEIISSIETPPSDIPWDLAFPCFKLSKQLKKSPNTIAEKILKLIETPSSFVATPFSKGGLRGFEKFENLGWYVNAFINVSDISNEVVGQILSLKNNYWKWEKKNETVVVESPWPNTNKPLHIWHVRNMLLGNSLSEILKFAWFEVKRVDIINDRWIHICKSMLAYQKFWNNQEPNKKTDHFVWDRYVRYAKELESHPEMEEEIKEMLQKRESQDLETMQLRKKMNDRAISWQQETYKRFWTIIDKAYYESDHYLKWKDLVLDFFNKWIFFKDEKWNIVFSSQDESQDNKVVLRSDWTSIYSTQDIWLVKIRYDDFKMDRMIYVVGNEQTEYFKVLFEIFASLWFKFADKCFHLAYWMIVLPEWRMKSREWTVVDADDLADELKKVAKEGIKNRYPELSENEVNDRAEIISLGAIKFFMLKYEVNKNFTFDTKESLSFEGETWPYVQYTYARCLSILNKSQFSSIKYQLNLLTTQEEKNLILHLAQFPNIVQHSANDYKPNLVVRYILELCKIFNNFYQKHKVLWDDENLQNARLILVECVRQVLENWLRLIGMETVDKM